MGKKRYTIITFRGYEECDDLGVAMEKGRDMIKEIVKDGWDHSLQWARVLDNWKAISTLMYRRLDDRFHYTNWLALK